MLLTDHRIDALYNISADILELFSLYARPMQVKNKWLYKFRIPH